MSREDFEHVLAAAARVTGEREFVVGSQPILAASADPPALMLRSLEADLYPLRSPELADAIDGALGDGSQFQRTFGYYPTASG
jgi:hypothetical protein